MKLLVTFLLLLAALSAAAGVYGDLEFGDNRETVTRKLANSPLVEQTIGDAFIGRTGLNGIFKCKAKLAGLTCHLYFDWDNNGGLREITLRSDELAMAQYDKELRQALRKAEAIFSGAYQAPTQKTAYPPVEAFKKHQLLVTHVWNRGGNQSILMGPGVEKGKCFLFIRFVNQSTVLPPS